MTKHLNNTIAELTKRMRLHVGLPKFWIDALTIATYLLNHGPFIPLYDRLQKEAWMEKEINLSHLNVFDCISYVDIDVK